MRQAAISDRYVDFANHCLQLAAATTENFFALFQKAHRAVEGSDLA